MTDQRIRCALVYRIESTPGGGGNKTSTGAFGADGEGDVAMTSLDGGATVTMLAKYDHASQYETHAGTVGDEGALYGGRDKSYADAVALVVGNDPPGAVAETGTLGGFKVVQSDVHQVVYGSDADGLCLAVITGLRYPSRVAIQMLTELYREYSDKFGLQVKSATVNSLSKKSKPLLSATCRKYDDLSQVDTAAGLHAKVEEVKVSMQDNIAAMLVNTEQADSLAQRSDQLNEQASVFKKKSTDLRKQMRCKNLKMTLILTFLVVGVLAVILVPLIIRAKNSND